MRIWIDLDNSPHIPFFAPLVREFRRRGHDVVITARDYAQTLELASHYGLPVIPVGKYGGASLAGKLSALVRRALELRRSVSRYRPTLALSHGSRSQVLAARSLSIPAFVCMDYEWTERWIFRWGAQCIVVPEVALAAALEAGLPSHRVWSYPGLKEEVYLPDFVPQAGFRERLGVAEGECLVVLRPPSVTANYRTSASLCLFEAVLRRLGREPSVVGLVLPRVAEDRKWVVEVCRRYGIENVRIAQQALPGLQLLYWADAVISGGGTMNREAALLGTPTYSVFAGRIGAVDQWLLHQGRLRLLQTPEQIEQLHIVRHCRAAAWRYPDRGLAAALVALIESLSSSNSR